VVTGCDTDPAGEIALQAFTFAQVRALGNGFLTLTGLVRGVGKRRGFVRDTLRMYRVGKRARSLPVFDWENHWAAPLAEVRALLGLPVVSVARAAA
jgi:ubiquinone biosynthesis protein COQ4